MKLLLALIALTVAANAGTFSMWSAAQAAEQKRAVAAEFKPEVFLEALAQKETGAGWDGKPGPCGELSRYQITETVWKQHMGATPFAYARDPDFADVCALNHFLWLIDRIEKAGVPLTVERLATCWHYGHTHRRKWSKWGQEVANLYEVLAR